MCAAVCDYCVLCCSLTQYIHLFDDDLYVVFVIGFCSFSAGLYDAFDKPLPPKPPTSCHQGASAKKQKKVGQSVNLATIYACSIIILLFVRR